MAASEPSTLYQLLQQQQEPFVLRIHLLQRGCPEKRLNLPNSFSCSGWILRKSIKRSVTFRLYGSRKKFSLCLKMIRTVYNQLISLKARPEWKLNHTDRRCIITQKSKPDLVEEYGGFSTATSTIMESLSVNDGIEKTTASLQQALRSFTTNNSQSMRLCSQTEKEVTPEGKLQIHCLENNKQLSPVSVLEEISSIGSPPPSTELTEIQKLVHSSHYSQDTRSKTEWPQTYKLILDSVKEVVETQSRSSMQEHHHRGYLESEELGKLIAEKMKPWRKQSRDKSILIKLQDSDFGHSGVQWSGYERDKKEVGLEIVDAILEETNAEIVTEMNELLSWTSHFNFLS